MSVTSVISSTLVFFIRAYRIFLSPIFPPSCRYYPTCSNYGIDAIQKHGPLKGAILTIKRILRCHPWADGGFDPVP